MHSKKPVLVRGFRGTLLIEQGGRCFVRIRKGASLVTAWVPQKDVERLLIRRKSK